MRSRVSNRVQTLGENYSTEKQMTSLDVEIDDVIVDDVYLRRAVRPAGINFPDL